VVSNPWRTYAIIDSPQVDAMISKAWQKLARQRLPRQLRDTYFALAHHCFGDKRRCCPSQRRLARMIDAFPSTVHDHIDLLVAWHVITRYHRGRHCEYELHDPAEWRVPRRRRRCKPQKPSVSADCSILRTEDRSNFIAPVRKKAASKKSKPISQPASRLLPQRRPTPLSPAEAERRPQQRAEAQQITRNKRLSMIRTARRWAENSPDLAEDERPYRSALLDRCEAQVDNWWTRSKEDQRAFDLLVARARAKPLDAAIIRSLRQRPRPPDDNSIGAILASQGWYHGDRIDRSS
jgi:hypothetical protein